MPHAFTAGRYVDKCHSATKLTYYSDLEFQVNLIFDFFCISFARVVLWLVQVVIR